MVAQHSGDRLVAMSLPGVSYTIQVPEHEVPGRLANGWRKLRSTRRADTGAVPVQGGGSHPSSAR